MMHQYGFKNTVAIMGTGFNEELVKVISSMTKNVVFALDSDGAGSIRHVKELMSFF